MQRQFISAAGLHAIDVDAMLLGGVVGMSTSEIAPHAVAEVAGFWPPEFDGPEEPEE